MSRTIDVARTSLAEMVRQRDELTAAIAELTHQITGVEATLAQRTRKPAA
jgi:prefoldin subunit 5